MLTTKPVTGTGTGTGAGTGHMLQRAYDTHDSNDPQSKGAMSAYRLRPAAGATGAHAHDDATALQLAQSGAGTGADDDPNVDVRARAPEDECNDNTGNSRLQWTVAQSDRRLQHGAPQPACNHDLRTSMDSYDSKDDDSTTSENLGGLVALAAPPFEWLLTTTKGINHDQHVDHGGALARFGGARPGLTIEPNEPVAEFHLAEQHRNIHDGVRTNPIHTLMGEDKGTKPVNTRTSRVGFELVSALGKDCVTVHVETPVQTDRQ